MDRAAQQLVEAFGWREIPRYMVRDRDCIYGARFIRRLRAMGIRDRPTAARSPCRTGMRRDLSAQSDESASTMSSSSASAISRLCYSTTRTITMNVERTYRWTRMLHSGVQFSSTAALPPTLFLADCIINIAEFEFSTGTRKEGCGWDPPPAGEIAKQVGKGLEIFRRAPRSAQRYRAGRSVSSTVEL